MMESENQGEMYTKTRLNLLFMNEDSKYDLFLCFFRYKFNSLIGNNLTLSHFLGFK